MLFLLFEAGDVAYAIESTSVTEVVPLVRFQQISNTHPAVAGIMKYRGIPVPVVDLGLLFANAPCRRYYSTRIIVIQHEQLNKRNNFLGLLAERVTDLFRCAPPIEKGHVRYLPLNPQSEKQKDPEKMIQVFDLQEMVFARLDVSPVYGI